VVSHREHTLFPSRIPPADFGNAVRVGIDLLRRAKERYGLPHHILGMNFLHPGGSSVPHPHLQANARGMAYSGVERVIGLSRAYREASGGSYWDELLETERREAARYLGVTGEVEWIVPFAPAHQKEVWGIFPGAGSLLELDDAAAEAFGAGIASVASFYEREGHYAFTLAFFSSPAVGAADHFSVQVRLCARPAFKPLYSNYDTWFVPKIIGDEVHTQAPEEYAGRIRESGLGNRG
jgi:galactose-1-phosphate uridylyltransferase